VNEVYTVYKRKNKKIMQRERKETIKYNSQHPSVKYNNNRTETHIQFILFVGFLLLLRKSKKTHAKGATHAPDERERKKRNIQTALLAQKEK